MLGRQVMTDICSAIRTRRLLEFYYKGRKRVVEPYCFGRSTADNDLLRAWQISGFSQTGRANWRLFDIDHPPGSVAPIS